MQHVVFSTIDALKGIMKNQIEEIKTETRGIINYEARTTSQASDKTIGVSDWHEKKAEAVQESRERVGEQQRQNKK